MRDFQLNSAVATGEAGVPLESLEMSQGLWSGHIGYLAIEFLVSEAPSGLLSLRTICEDVAAGVSVEQASGDAFGMTNDHFYEEAWSAHFDGLTDEFTPTP